MATIDARINHLSGIPLGGLGTGSVEIRPDGHFHEWQIFNLGLWAPRQPEACRFDTPDVKPGSLAFYVRVQAAAGAPLMRRLGMRTEQEDLYSFTWLKSVKAIGFDGRYPVVRLRYEDDDLPVSVEGEMFSPFIPHEAQTSGTPGFYMVFRVRNRSRQALHVSLLGALKNFLASGAEERKLKNAIGESGGTTYLTMTTGANGSDCRHPTVGSLCFSVTGGDRSWIAGEYADFLPGYHLSHWQFPQSEYGIAHESWLHDYRRDGRLPSLSGGESPSGLLPLTDAELDDMPADACWSLMRRLLDYPFAASLMKRLERCGQAPRSRGDGRRFLKEVGYRIARMEGQDRRRQTWGDGAVAAALRLGPGEEKEACFALSWHFPYHYSAKGPVLGHAYENWFAGAEAVNRFLVKHAARLRRDTVAFVDGLFDTTLDPVLAEAWSSQLSTLTKCTWWTKDGKFAVWEGLGCCGFHTTDITYQGSFSLLALFPELEKRQMEMGARFQRKDGRVHHLFTPDLSAVDEGFDRVDMNQQFVLLACRDYLWTGDRDYLKRLWPPIARAMDSTAELDRDQDGLPDQDTRRNTYDGWNFYGTPSYIASLWLSALKAGIRLAADLGEREAAARWQAMLDKGVESFERKLWNGEYYSLWVDGETRDECCMTDQLDGEWFTQLVGLGHCLPRKRIVAALRAALKYNFRPEEGLINASYPPGVKPRLSTCDNFQAMAPWTGIEYAIASMMMDFGLSRDALAVVRNIHERYLRAGRFWSHVECGSHYYRAMSSWAVLLGATGFKIDVPRSTLTIAPAYRRREVRAPWVSATGWGTFVQGGRSFELRCRAGEVRFRTLKLRGGPGLRARLDGRPLTASVRQEQDLAAVTFGREVRLKAGQSVTLAARA